MVNNFVQHPSIKLLAFIQIYIFLKLYIHNKYNHKKPNKTIMLKLKAEKESEKANFTNKIS